MRGHNIRFPREIRKIIFELSSIPPSNQELTTVFPLLLYIHQTDTVLQYPTKNINLVLQYPTKNINLSFVYVCVGGGGGGGGREGENCQKNRQ